MIDFDKEKQNFHDKFDAQIMTEQNWMLYDYGIAQTWNPMDPEPQKTSESFAIYAAKFMHLTASGVPPNHTRGLEAKIEQKAEIQSLQRDLESTQDSLSSSDEGKLKLLHGVCVDESVR